MASEINGLVFARREIGAWTIPTIGFNRATHTPLRLAVIGTIINSITEHKEKQRSWKVQVASAVKAARGMEPWHAEDAYAITLGLSFHPANHGGRSLDVENFIKPIIDGIAAGLFCNPQTNPQSIAHWNYDDSNFNTLLIHRLADATNRRDEGIAICVSSNH